MANKLFREMSGQNQNGGNNLISEYQSLRSNPIQYLMRKRLNVPPEIANNPQAIVQYLMNSGQMSQQQFNELQQKVAQMPNM